MPINALLCRWAEGWREVLHPASIATYGRREAFLSLGAVQTRDEVDRVGGMQLNVVANPRMAIAADLAPMGQADKPYRTFSVGDTITVPNYGGGTISQRVRALTGAEDEVGEITYSPELGDLILEEQERTLQAVKKMADGTLEGDSPVAQPRLKPQIIRVWAAPAKPPGGLEIFSADADVGGGGGAYTGVSDALSGGDGGQEYTLVSFTAQIPAVHQVDGTNSFFVLRNIFGDISLDVAEIDLGVDHNAGTFTGTIYRPTMTTVGGWQIQMEGGGQFGGPFRVSALTTSEGPSIKLDWHPQS